MLLIITLYNLYKQNQMIERLIRQEVLQQNSQQFFQQFSTSQEQKAQALQEMLNTTQEKILNASLNGLTILQESMHKHMHESRSQISSALKEHAEILNQQLNKLTHETNERLREISGQVERRLAEGFEKTTATFADVVKRLALIDEAQKKITELSSNVVSLQEVLVDKRARGAFGEVQLAALVRNVLPENSFAFQHTLSNGKRADCILFLPNPTGNVVIDAKFPLETFRKLLDLKLSDSDREKHERQFRIDVRKHITDIAEKYIIANETADGAMMFLPSEAVFAEIHAHYPDLIEEAYKKRVWLTSPTTMMAILNTARAVLKDEDTRKQIHIIQEHLNFLAQDFARFQERMEKLAKHIEQANQDAKDIHTSARKITSRFQKIEKVELTNKTVEMVEE
jgi:DNA recombination protein RmuC